MRDGAADRRLSGEAPRRTPGPRPLRAHVGPGHVDVLVRARGHAHRKRDWLSCGAAGGTGGVIALRAARADPGAGTGCRSRGDDACRHQDDCCDGGADAPEPSHTVPSHKFLLASARTVVGEGWAGNTGRCEKKTSTWSYSPGTVLFRTYALDAQQATAVHTDTSLPQARDRPVSHGVASARDMSSGAP
jgi:hypothetical protein